MKAIKIKIVSYISDSQPGFVKCKFKDAWNTEHIVEEKVPIVTEIYLDANSEYPQDGLIACEIEREWIDKDGRMILSVNTEKPWTVDTIDGLTKFELLKEQITELNR